MNVGTKLIDDIITKQVSTLAIIGMEKNTGKTVTLNTVVTEAVSQKMNIAIVSYGRDGEEVDAITKHKKPRIYIPTGTMFVTAQDAITKSNFRVELMAELEHQTLLGKVGLYYNRGEGGYCELVGINSTTQMQKVKQLVEKRGDIDLLLIDGALDRKSSAVPDISQGFIMATGANIANTEEMVVEKTEYELKKLTTPEIDNEILSQQARQLAERGVTAIITEEKKPIELSTGCSFGDYDWICSQLESYRDQLSALVVSGALTDTLIKKILYQTNLYKGKIVVKDGTKIFIKNRNRNLLAKKGIALRVLDSLSLVAVTVNPWSTRGVYLNSEKLIAGLQDYVDVPVYDLKSSQYAGIEYEIKG